MPDEYFELSATFISETVLAVFIEDGTRDSDGKRNAYWIPKSLIEEPNVLDQLKHGEAFELSVKTWFLEKEGIV